MKDGLIKRIDQQHQDLELFNLLKLVKRFLIVLDGRKGRKHSKETRVKISNSNRGRKCSEETRKKISQSETGKIVSQETRNKMKNRKKILCIYCNKEFDPANYKQWHGEKCKFIINWQ